MISVLYLIEVESGLQVGMKCHCGICNLFIPLPKTLFSSNERNRYDTCSDVAVTRALAGNQLYLCIRHRYMDYTQPWIYITYNKFPATQ